MLVHEQISRFVTEQLPGASVVFARPDGAAPATPRGVGLYLFALHERTRSGVREQAPLALEARFLVTAWAEKEEAAHEMLATLAFAAAEADGLTLRADPPEMAFWLAMGLPPRPALVFGAPIHRFRAVAPEAIVTHEPDVRFVTRAAVSGVLVTPKGQPIAGAEVALEPLDRRTRTDAKGRFEFAGVPLGLPTLTMVFAARGRRHVVALNGDADGFKPVQVEWEPRKD